MKKPIAVISTDWHIDQKNTEVIYNLIDQQCRLAKELNVRDLICLGDVFESRIAQREEVLNTFKRILDLVEFHEMKLHVIPGNHDKTDYSSESSFLQPFDSHKAIHLINEKSRVFKIEDVVFYCLPFFSDEKYLSEFEKIKEYRVQYHNEKNNILLTHIAVTGSVNNDGTKVSSSISSKLFKDFNKVFSGHYHNQQKIVPNFYHLPSIQQNNFGENAQKGFTVVYSDTSHELFRSRFKEFIKISINLDQCTQEELNDLKRKWNHSDDNIRFELIGSENVLKSIKKEDFTSLGIEIITKSREIIDDIIYSESSEVIEHTKDSIMEVFKEFCEKENYNYERGIEYLKKKLK